MPAAVGSGAGAGAGADELFGPETFAGVSVVTGAFEAITGDSGLEPAQPIVE